MCLRGVTLFIKYFVFLIVVKMFLHCHSQYYFIDLNMIRFNASLSQHNIPQITTRYNKSLNEAIKIPHLINQTKLYALKIITKLFIIWKKLSKAIKLFTIVNS